MLFQAKIVERVEKAFTNACVNKCARVAQYVLVFAIRKHTGYYAILSPFAYEVIWTRGEAHGLFRARLVPGG
jgi:hypothetical protein